jgi:hypothetical protein
MARGSPQLSRSTCTLISPGAHLGYYTLQFQPTGQLRLCRFTRRQRRSGVWCPPYPSEAFRSYQRSALPCTASRAKHSTLLQWRIYVRLTCHALILTPSTSRSLGCVRATVSTGSVRYQPRPISPSSVQTRTFYSKMPASNDSPTKLSIYSIAWHLASPLFATLHNYNITLRIGSYSTRD